MSKITHRSSAGFTLIEVLIASMLAAAIATGVAHLIAIGINANRAAREQTLTTLLAASKIEQLRSLSWTFEPGSDAPPPMRSDLSTDLSVDPAVAGGPGLSPSPPGTLQSRAHGYCDYLDDEGKWVGNGAEPPARAAFVRRWAVQPLPEDPGSTLILSVLVSTVAQERRRAGTWTARSETEALLVTLVTRKGRQ
jgi:prepilin-type N-terminal cleavage/methylation domain-containing protein